MLYTLVMGAPAIQLHGERIVRPAQKEVQTKAMKGLLDFAILNFLRVQPMHGYQIISSLRKDFGVYFGPSTIYPLLSVLEKQGYVKGQWDLENARARPRKVYNLTSQGANMLTSMAVSLNHIYKKLTKDWTSAQR